LVSGIDCRERFLLRSTVGARPVGIGAFGRLAGLRQTTSPRRVRRRDSAGGIILCRSNQILQPCFDGEQLPQPLAIGLVDRGVCHQYLE
jgi:hypothetical protein